MLMPEIFLLGMEVKQFDANSGLQKANNFLASEKIT